MRFLSRKLLTLALVASYGGIALVGQGLHYLAPHAGHHHGLQVVECSHEDGDGHHHHHGHVHGHHSHTQAGHDHHACVMKPSARADGCAGHECGKNDGLVLASSRCDTHSHLCEICAFLLQLRSERPVLASAVSQPLAEAAVCVPTLLYTPTSLGLHRLRGPPRSTVSSAACCAPLKAAAWFFMRVGWTILPVGADVSILNEH